MRFRLASTLLSILSMVLVWDNAKAAEDNAVVLLPIVDKAALKKDEYQYLGDVVQGTLMEALGARLKKLSDQEMTENVGLRKDPLKTCDEACLSQIGRSLSADYIIAGEWLRLSGELRGVFRIVDVANGRLLHIKRATGKTASELDKALPACINELLVDLTVQSSTSASPPVSAPSPKAYADVTITATATKAAAPEKDPFEIAAEVYLNGVRVGKTPYNDGLPSDVYLLEVRYQDAPPVRRTFSVQAPGPYNINVEMKVPLTAAEKAAVQAKAAAEKTRRMKQALELWQNKHDVWQKKMAEIKPKRKLFRLIGAIAIPTGSVAIVGGAVLMARAKHDLETATLNENAWRSAVEESDISMYADRYNDANHAYLVKKRTGIALISVGSTLSVAGVVFLLVAPRLPKAPKKPYELREWELSGLSITPVVTAEHAGVLLSTDF